MTHRRWPNISRGSASARAVLASFLAALSTAAMGSGAEASEAGMVELRYRVAYGALPVGHADMRVDLTKPGRYDVETTFGTGGLVKLIRQTEGRVSASGSLGNAIGPSAFDLAYSYGDRSRARAIGFRGGTVGDVSITPPPKADDERATPTAAQLRGAIDPASALIVPAPAEDDPCGRSVKVFDGRALLKLALSPLSAKPFRAGDWRGEVRVCRVAVSAIAGVKDSTRDEMEAVSGTTLAFAPVPGRDAWVAVELRVPSSAGMVSARAVELTFGASP